MGFRFGNWGRGFLEGDNGSKGFFRGCRNMVVRR